jgi:hypothetical protein
MSGRSTRHGTGRLHEENERLLVAEAGVDMTVGSEHVPSEDQERTSIGVEVFDDEEDGEPMRNHQEPAHFYLEPAPTDSHWLCEGRCLVAPDYRASFALCSIFVVATTLFLSLVYVPQCVC